MPYFSANVQKQQQTSQQQHRRSSSTNRMSLTSRQGNLSGASPKIPARPKLVSHHTSGALPLVKKDSEVDMVDGIVDMEAFSQILALDETDKTQEFSKALVWAWCDQAEHSVEEMEHFLAKGDVNQLASKAHYLKGSSASLGLINVSRTCQSLYHIHFPPSLAHFRSYSYQSDYSSASLATPPLSSASSSSDSDSSGRTATPASCSPKVTGGPGMISPGQSPDLTLAPAAPMDFEANKLARAQELLNVLKTEIKEASEWIYSYYKASDEYAARSP